MAVRIINLRAAASGGGLAENPVLPPINSSRIVILIHGYNNTLADARDAYFSFFRPGRGRSGIGSLPPYAWIAYTERIYGETFEALSAFGDIYLTFWPGDPIGRWVSAVRYNDTIPIAQDAANALGNLILQQLDGIPGGGPLEIILICHSLGNRLALEFVNFLRGDDRVRFTVMSLMAAALPVSMLNEERQPFDLAPAVGSIARKLTLYSGSDSIVGFFFPIFERYAPDSLPHPEAVGHAGNPQNGVWTEPDEMAGYRHSDYWSGDESRTRTIKFLGAPIPSAPRSSALSANVLPPAAQPAANAIDSRPTLSRRIPG